MQEPPRGSAMALLRTQCGSLLWSLWLHCEEPPRENPGRRPLKSVASVPLARNKKKEDESSTLEATPRVKNSRVADGRSPTRTSCGARKIRVKTKQDGWMMDGWMDEKSHFLSEFTAFVEATWQPQLTPPQYIPPPPDLGHSILFHQ